MIIVTTGLKLQVVTIEVGTTRQNSLAVLLRRLVDMIVIGMSLNKMFDFVENLYHSICTAFVELLCEYPCVASGTAFEQRFPHRYHICTAPDFLHGIF